MKKLLYALGVILIVIGAYWFYDVRNTTTPGETTNPGSGNVTYMEVPRWGIRIKTPPGLEDLKYEHSEGIVDYIYLSTSTIENINKECGPRYGTLGALVRTKNVEDQRAKEPVKVGDYYYYYSGPQAPCLQAEEDKDNVQGKAFKILSPLIRNNFKENIELLPN